MTILLLLAHAKTLFSQLTLVYFNSFNSVKIY